MKNNIFARFARAYFIFCHFVDVLVLSGTWNHLFCSCVDDVSIWSQMFNFVFLCPKRWFQCNSRIVTTQFSSVMILNSWKIIAETQSYIFRWRSCFRRRRVCLSSVVFCRGRRGMFFLSAGHTCNTLIFHQSTNQILNRPSSIYQYQGLRLAYEPGFLAAKS